MDLGLFKDAADLSFTWYKRNSTDVILLVPVAASSGDTVQGANAAKIRNAGTEWALNIRPITRKNFAWEVGHRARHQPEPGRGPPRGAVRHLRRPGRRDSGRPDRGGRGRSADRRLPGLRLRPLRPRRDPHRRRRQPLRRGRQLHAPRRSRARRSSSTTGRFTNSSGIGSNGPGFPLLDPTQYVIADPEPQVDRLGPHQRPESATSPSRGWSTCGTAARSGTGPARRSTRSGRRPRARSEARTWCSGRAFCRARSPGPARGRRPCWIRTSSPTTTAGRSPAPSGSRSTRTAAS